MKKLFAVLFTMLLLSGCAGNATLNSQDVKTDVMNSTQSFQNVDVQAAKALISSGNFTILDVRTAEEYLAGHIPGAANLDFNNSAFLTQLNGLDKSNRYLVYCRSGRRSAEASKIMQDKGFNITNLLGGIIDWEKAGEEICQKC